MKNIEFYYDELIKMSNVRDASMFACSKGKGREIRSHADYINWLNEEHQILDKVEKKYLSSVIKPFRKRIKYIKKVYACCGLYEFIRIVVEPYYEENSYDYIDLPLFESKLMYKGMKADEIYTLEELGL